MELPSGERLIFEGENNLIKVLSGKIEVYAVTKDAENFRQIFLMPCATGDLIFPMADDFDFIETLIYAAENSEVEKVPIKNFSAAELKLSMQNWFSRLIELSQIRKLADRGDENLKSWLNKTIFINCGDSKEKILETFFNEEKIFSMLIGVHFRADYKKFAERIDIRQKQKKRLIEDSVSTLLGEEKFFADELETNLSQKTDEATFILTNSPRLNSGDTTFA